MHVFFNQMSGIKESDTGLAAPSQWDLVSDKQMMQEEQPLQVHLFRFLLNRLLNLLIYASCTQRERDVGMHTLIYMNF